MAEKNCVPLPYNIKTEDGGLSLRIEFDAHYLSDDEADAIRMYIEELRELVRDYDKALDDAVYVWGTVADFLGYGRKYDALHDRMRELGVEVEQWT